MSKDNGYFPARRGIWEHFSDGRMTPLRFTVHQFIVSQADTRTGVWVGCAKSIASALCISERIARRALESLTRLDYLRRFPVPGKHVCYPILVHKFYPTNGEHRGEQLDAVTSLSPMDLRYVPIENGEHRGEQGGEHLSPQKRSDTGKGKRKESAQAAPSLSFSGQHFSVTKKQDALLGEAFPWIDRSAEYRKADSWLEANPERRPKKANRFLHNWFARIGQPGKGGSRGKPDTNEAVAITMQAAAANARRPN